MSFANKVVIITGGSSGIGAATAEIFAKEKAEVVVVGRNEDKLRKVSEKCEKIGKKPLVIKADLTIEDDVKRIINETVKRYGKIDVLINNAGAAIAKSSIEDKNALQIFDASIKTNLRSVIQLTNLAAPYLIKTKGSIVNVSSIGAFKVFPDFWPYGVAKAGLDHYTRNAAIELAPKGVRVNTVNPGPVKTDFLINIGMPEDASTTVMGEFTNKTPLRRVSDSQEIGELIMFLASDKARGITAASYVVDNGWSYAMQTVGL